MWTVELELELKLERLHNTCDEVIYYLMDEMGSMNSVCGVGLVSRLQGKKEVGVRFRKI